MDNLVYHYTSLEALDGIVGKDNVTFRATRYGYLNDPFEKIWALSYLMSFIESDLKRTNHSPNIINKLIDRHPYIISFCEIPDYRNLWRLYCNDGIGICIGVNSDLLRQIANENLHNDPQMKQDYFEYVYYCSRMKVCETINDLKSRKIFNFNKNDEYDNLYAMAAFVKCDDFDIEHEVRYARLRENSSVSIRFDVTVNDFFSKETEDIQGVKYRMRGTNQKVPYLDVEFPSNVIEKIIVGYGYCNFEDVSQCIRQILCKNTLLANLNIEKSKINS